MQVALDLLIVNSIFLLELSLGSPQLFTVCLAFWSTILTSEMAQDTQLKTLCFPCPHNLTLSHSSRNVVQNACELHSQVYHSNRPTPL